MSSETGISALPTIIVAIENDNELLRRTGDLNAPGDNGDSKHRSEASELYQLDPRSTAFIFTEI